MNVLVELAIITCIGWIGTVLFKIGTEGFGPLNFGMFFTRDFVTKALTSRSGWIIFVSLLVNLTARVLLMSPLSKERYAIVMTISAPLGMTLTLIAGYFIFHEAYTLKELFGVVFATIGMLLIGGAF